MYIVAIAWLYVTLMMAITEPNVIAGVMTFLFYGVAPLSLLLWLVGTPARKRRLSAHQVVDHEVSPPDRRDPGSDQ